MEITKIYFDMDGVLADFDRGIEGLCGLLKRNQNEKDEKADEEMWAKVREIPHFYDKLEPVSGAVETFCRLWEKYGDKCEILTGIPKPRRGIATAGEDKINWAHRLLDPQLKVNIVFKEEKKNFCTGKGDILIDDYEPNIREWEAAGGTGILFQSWKDVEREKIF